METTVNVNVSTAPKARVRLDNLGASLVFEIMVAKIIIAITHRVKNVKLRLSKSRDRL